MSARILNYRVPPNTAFAALVHSMPILPFKVPVTGQNHVLAFPDILELGRAEYGAVIDVWLGGIMSSAFSETVTVIVHSCWQLVLEKVCNLL